MGNDMVGQIIDEFNKTRPEKTVIKIWNNGKLYVILAARDPQNYKMEMDPYYMYTEGKLFGVSYIDNADTMEKVVRPENLIYMKK